MKQNIMHIHNMITSIRNNFEEARRMIDLFLEKEENLKMVEKAVLTIVHSLTTGHKVITCGNGGSMCDAMHFAEELTGRFRNDRKPLPALALSDPSLITCIGNDYGFDHIFSRPVEAWGNEGDILLVFTSSGNSVNLLEAAKTARRKGMTIIGLTGKSGGKMAALCDVEIRAPMSKYADRAQEIHGKIVHIMLDAIEHALGLANE